MDRIASAFAGGKDWMQIQQADMRPLTQYKQNCDILFQAKYVAALREAVRGEIKKANIFLAAGSMDLAVKCANIAGRIYADYRRNLTHYLILRRDIGKRKTLGGAE